MPLTHVENPVDNAGLTHQVLSNLFYGWGYNFYRDENKVRADDLIIRNKASERLGTAKDHLSALERAYRRKALPPPTREKPTPDPEAIALAKELVFAQQALEVRVRTAAVPERDLITQRHRNELATLTVLAAADEAVVRTAWELCDTLEAITDPVVAADTWQTVLARSGLANALKDREERLSMWVR